jgi:hypothetical protein
MVKPSSSRLDARVYQQSRQREAVFVRAQASGILLFPNSGAPL